MELSTIFWICGVAAAYYAGKTLAKVKSKGEISILKSQLSISIAEVEKLKSQQETGVSEDVPNPNQISAREAFMCNLEKFVPLLANLEKGEIDWSKWSDVVVDINNKNLFHVWESVLNKLDAWMTVMASWGLKFDTCIDFVYVKGREEMYDNEDGTSMEEGYRYIVLSPCWILTMTGGNKRVLKKGLVKQKK